MLTSLGFVATKPLQVMIATLVARRLRPDRAILAVVPNFADGDAVIARLASTTHDFDTVYSARSRIVAMTDLARRGVGRILLDRDIGARTPLAMRLLRVARPGIRFSMYEEGESLFVPDEEDRPGPLLERFGARMTMGEDALTEEVWTFAPEELAARLDRKPLRRIEPDLASFVAAEREWLTSVFWPSHLRDAAAWPGGTCAIYLSSRVIHPPAFEHLRRSGSFTICKLHPHLRTGDEPPGRVDQCLPAAVPAELALLALAERFEQVRVVHHGTSTTRYARADNLRFVRIPGPGEHERAPAAATKTLTES